MNLNRINKILEKLLIIFPLTFLFSNCNLGNFADEIKQTKHYKVSPDKKVIIYQDEFKEEGKFFISLTTWVYSKGSYGGSGILNINSSKSLKLEMKWVNDSLVQIKIPRKAIILSKEGSSYYYGRKTYFEYITE